MVKYGSLILAAIFCGCARPAPTSFPEEMPFVGAERTKAIGEIERMPGMRVKALFEYYTIYFETPDARNHFEGTARSSLRAGPLILSEQSGADVLAAARSTPGIRVQRMSPPDSQVARTASDLTPESKDRAGEVICAESVSLERVGNAWRVGIGAIRAKSLDTRQITASNDEQFWTGYGGAELEIGQWMYRIATCKDGSPGRLAVLFHLQGVHYKDTATDAPAMAQRPSSEKARG